MYRMVTNSAMNLLKREVASGGSDGRHSWTGPPGAPGQDGWRTRTQAASAELQTLPPAARTVLWLKDVYGLSCKEIGDELGIEEGAVKSGCTGPASASRSDWRPPAMRSRSSALRCEEVRPLLPAVVDDEASLRSPRT